VAAACNKDGTDESDCKTLYDSIVADSTSAKWGDGSKLVVEVNEFISKCKKALCNDGCDTTLNAKDLSAASTSFEADFKEKCKPADPPSPEGNNNGSGRLEISKMIVAMSIAAASIHLILLN
jgi:hypothetical protein